MSHEQIEPNREVVVSDTLHVYVSDAGCLVIEQTFGDSHQVFFDPGEAAAVVAAITALTRSAAAKQSAREVAADAEYSAWKALGNP